MHDLIIASTTIRRDAEGRFSLNDLHRAAGGEAADRPGYWLVNQKTAELIRELETTGISAVNTIEGRGGGTYVAEQLVVSYAAWISPKFHLEVLNNFLAAKKTNVRALPSFVEDGCALIESATRTLRLAQSTTLGMYQKLSAKVGHQGLLPAYAVDAPEGEGSSRPTKALRDLLLDHGIQLSAQRAYQLLLEKGVVERKSRRSSKGTNKPFWCVTDAGLKYGKNLSHGESARQTQPHFYECVFAELLTLIGLKSRTAASVS